ncbi:tRNA synthetases class I (R)-domain-containing protein, partial [Thamnocephalis sphaerospora]
MPLTPFKNDIVDQLVGLTGADRNLILEAIETPRTPEHGDFAVALPRLRLKGNPAAFAKEYAEKFQPTERVLSANAIGPFLNFSINKLVLRDLVLRQVAEEGERFGQNTTGAGKRVIVEFSSPNIAKPFHAGHLRSTIIGNFVNNVLKANGYETISMNYLGDWGKQYGLLALGFLKYGNEEEMQKDVMEVDGSGR